MIRFPALASISLVLLAGLVACGQADERTDARATVQAQSRAAPSAPAPPAVPLPPQPPAFGESLIARSALFGAPQRIQGRLSPDGTRVSWRALYGGALNIWVGPADAPDRAKPLTTEREDVRSYSWAANASHILYAVGPNDALQLKALDVGSGTTRVLSPQPSGEAVPSDEPVITYLANTSFDFPDTVIIKSNARDRRYFDAYKVNLYAGEPERVFTNTGGFVQLHFDSQLRLVAGEKANASGGRDIIAFDRTGGTRAIVSWGFEDSVASRIVSVDGSGKHLIALDSTGQDEAALVRIALAGGAREVLAQVRGADIAEVLLHPTTGEPEAFVVDRLAVEWIALSSRTAEAFALFDRVLKGVPRVLARTVDDTVWTVFSTGPTNPGTYALYSPDQGELRPLFATRPDLPARRLAPMTATVIKTDDGAELVGYLTLPPGADEDGDGRPERTSPLVITPFANERARYDYREEDQWLADRGYAVLAVNVRGARGFGKAFRTVETAPFSEVAVADTLTAGAWAVERGVTTPDTIAFFGIGERGVVALRALAEAGDTHACAAAVDAPIDLVAFVEGAPTSAAPMAAMIARWYGDVNDPAARARLDALSPQSFLRTTTRPFLLAHTTLPEQAAAGRASVAAAHARGLAAQWSEVLPEADLSPPRARLLAYGATEAFFADCLGGPAEPLSASERASMAFARLDGR